MTYRIGTILMTFSDLEDHLPVARSFQLGFFMQLCSCWQHFNWQRITQSLSLAEPLVDIQDPEGVCEKQISGCEFVYCRQKPLPCCTDVEHVISFNYQFEWEEYCNKMFLSNIWPIKHHRCVTFMVISTIFNYFNLFQLH